MGLILGVDGGNSKTELLAATDDGELLALVRGPGSNSHAIGADGVAAVIGRLVADAGIGLPADHGVFFLCGADVPVDVAELEREVARGAWVRRAQVDNDTFALLYAGTDRPDAVAVVCGAGLNCVGRRADGRVARYPALGWETGDWGGADAVGREALFFAARAEDGRGGETTLVDAIRRHFGAASIEDVGADVHYKRLATARLGELAPLVVAEASAGDAVAEALVDRLAGEIVLFVERALRDLELQEADVVLGGGMFQNGSTLLYERVAARLPAGAVPVLLQDPPVLGAALVALDAVCAAPAAKHRLRKELRER
jgi:N-acetylglucosamine kinase-like BadF-type ATPase